MMKVNVDFCGYYSAEWSIFLSINLYSIHSTMDNLHEFVLENYFI